jgi:hypothetical protein
MVIESTTNSNCNLVANYFILKLQLVSVFTPQALSFISLSHDFKIVMLIAQSSPIMINIASGLSNPI